MTQSDRPAVPRLFVAASVVGCLAAVAIWAVGRRLDFHVIHNDHFGLLRLAQTSDGFAGLYNGFYPIGYPLLLDTLGGAGTPAGMFAINALCAAALAAAVVVAVHGVRAPVAAGVVGAVVAFGHPAAATYALTPGPDPLALAFAAVGLAALLHATGRTVVREQWLLALLGGIALGAAALFRSHFIVVAAGSVMAFAIAERRWKLAAVAGIAAGLTWAPQGLAAIAAGHHPLAGSQWFNVYKTVHSVDWYRTSAIAPVSVSSLLAEPGAAGDWLRGVARLAPFALGAPALLAVLGEGRERRWGYGWLAFGTVYSLLAAAGYSDRAVLPLLPVAAIAAAGAIGAAGRRWPHAAKRGPRAVGYAALLIACGGSWWSLRGDAVGWSNERALLGAVEQRLVEAGMTTSSEVFSSEFFVYLPTTAPGWVETPGGWLRVQGAGGLDNAPDVCTDDYACFVDDLYRRDIRFLLLTPYAARIAPELGHVYRGTGNDVRLAPLDDVAGIRIFRLVPPPR